jgi:hypothetical protein
LESTWPFRLISRWTILNLAPQIQEALLFPNDCERVSEHDLRAVTHAAVWQDQITALDARLAA